METFPSPRYRALIADDEPLGRQGLIDLLQSDPEIEIVAACADGGAARENLQLLQPDLAFLDVQMPVCDGLQVMSQMAPEIRPAVVLVTAFHEYAVSAFDLSVADYVVKPFREDRFREAVAKAKAAADARRRPATGAPAAPRRADRLAFKVARGHVLLDPADILWIEASGDNVKIREGTETHQVREPLQQVERRLPPGALMRVHRSFLVNPAGIRRVTSLLYGETELLMSDGVRIRVGRSFRDQLKILLAAPSNR